MKKTYINPNIKDVELIVQHFLASSPTLGGTYNGGTILAPGMSDDDDDFDFDE